jgi:hypothetical protein
VTDTQLSGAFSQLENGDRPHPEVNIWEEPVHQKYCEEGLKFDTVYFERTRAWVGAEADKRVAVAGNRAMGVNEWNEIARRAAEAKMGHEQALRDYMDHVIACSVCHAHVLGAPSEYLVEHMH